MDHNQIVGFIWNIANLIRDHYRRSKYPDVILPFTILRRIDCVLAPTKEKVLEKYERYKKDLENLDPVLCQASGYAFYNTSPYDFERLLDDSAGLADNLKATIHAFSSNMREVLEMFMIAYDLPHPDDLDPAEHHLLDLYRQLSDQDRKHAIQIVEILANRSPNQTPEAES